ncbi:MAG: NnrS family protein [Rhodoferax sp.]
MPTPPIRATAVLQPQEPAPKAPVAPSLKAFLELAFRPLYLAGVAWALVAIALWIYAPSVLTAPLGGIAWHAHEMLWGFIATIALAFLMTAGASWTGITPMTGRVLALACALWAVARIGFLLPLESAFWVATTSELVFFLLGSVAMLRAVVVSKNSRNYAVPGLLAGLGATDALYLLTARGGDYLLLMQRFNAGLLVMALIALLIGRRVIPFFAMRAVHGLSIPKHLETGWVQLGACAVAVVSLLAGISLLSAAALGLAGVLALVQLISWKPLAVRANALLWILYVGYASIGIGLLMAALQYAGVDLPRVLPVHTIAMAGFSVLIIGMVTRTALGHTGRPLATDRTMRTSYWCMLIAIALRLAAIANTPATPTLLHMAAAAWIASLALYLWQFTPILIRPRQ